MNMLKTTIAALGLLNASFAASAADTYNIDPSHAAASFVYKHLGFSDQFGMIDSVEGVISYDAAAPDKSSVTATLKVANLDTGWEKRDEHIRAADMLDAAKFPTITFKSTKIAKTGDNQADITGDLTIKGVTKSVVLKTTLNKVGPNPISKKEAIGLTATTTIKRSEFGVGYAVPAVSDEMVINLNIEAVK